MFFSILPTLNILTMKVDSLRKKVVLRITTLMLVVIIAIPRIRIMVIEIIMHSSCSLALV